MLQLRIQYPDAVAGFDNSGAFSTVGEQWEGVVPVGNESCNRWHSPFQFEWRASEGRQYDAVTLRRSNNKSSLLHTKSFLL
jgi:hypothetical protein